jgi:hypothetical protein
MNIFNLKSKLIPGCWLHRSSIYPSCSRC